jgi:hypothetical protein
MTNVTFVDDFLPFQSEIHVQSEGKYVGRVQGAKNNVHLCTLKAVYEFKPNANFKPTKQMEAFFFGALRIPKDW